MLKFAHRLRAQEVKKVIISGRSVRAAHLHMKYQKTSESLRAAVVAPKSLLRKATARNRVRRAVYQALSSISRTHEGRAVFFVRSVPTEPITSAFALDLKSLMSKI